MPLAPSSDINQLALKVATFESRILLLESKLVQAQAKIDALKTALDNQYA